MIRTRSMNVLQHGRRSRRGSVYVLVLGFSTLVTIVGVGAVALAQASSRRSSLAREWTEAGLAARSGIALTMAWMNSNDRWRTTATSGTALPTITLGRCSVAVTLIDSTGSLSDNIMDSVTARAVATCGSATRVYSSTLTPASAGGLDVLRCPVHCAGTLTTSGTVRLSGGPISTDGTLKNSATIGGDAEVQSLSNSGNITGKVTVQSTSKTLPAASIMATMSSGATVVNAPLLLPTISKTLLSSTNNPMGAVNARGLYVINVPVATTLTISKCRIKANVLVNLSSSSSLRIAGSVLWEPADPSLPTLIVNGAALSTVDFGADSADLAESDVGANLNPPGCPYNSVSNTTQTDTYPSQICGVVQVFNTGATVSNAQKFFGTLILTQDSSISGTPTFTADPSLLASPPTGCGRPSGGMMLRTRGGTTWDVTLTPE